MRKNRFRRAIRIGYCVALCLTAVGPALAEPDLSVTGARLAPVVLQNVAAGVVEKQINLDGDVPTATYVVVQLAGHQLLMRDRQGVFQPWDRNPAHLADNGFAPVGQGLLFKVLNQDLSANNFPIRVTLYYRVNDVLKFGYFDVMRAN